MDKNFKDPQTIILIGKLSSHAAGLEPAEVKDFLRNFTS